MDKLTEFLKTTLPGLMEDFDLKNYLPKLDTLWGTVELLIRIFVMAGPLILLGLGLWYFLAPPKEANHRAGFRTLWGMGSVEAWKYTQRLAGFGYMVLGGALTLAMIIVNLCLIGAETLTLLTTAAICLVIELVLTGLGVLALNIFLAIRYDRDGYLREER